MRRFPFRRQRSWLRVAVAMAVVCAASAPTKGAKRRADPEYVAPDIYTPQVVVEHMLRLADVKPGDRVIDLGCGDGRIVITAARLHGASGVCVDLDQRQLGMARKKARAAGVEDGIDFVQQDLFAFDVSAATVLTLYLSKRVNERLGPMLEKALKPGTRVLSHQFDIPGWFPLATLVVRDEHRIERKVYLWEMGRHRVPPRKVDLTPAR